MFILKNAWKNILRTKGRTILIFIIVLMISLGSCLALSVRQSAEITKENGLKNLSVTAQITMNRKKIMEQSDESKNNSNQNPFESVKELTLEEMQTYAQSSYVKDFSYTLTTSVNGSAVSPVSAASSSNSDNSESAQGEFAPKEGQTSPPKGMGNEGEFTIIGYSSYSAMTDFSSGVCTLKEGTLFDEQSSDATCIISDELAQNNHLSVESIITVLNPNDTSQSYTLKVNGIYTNSNSGQSGGSMRGFSTANDPANQILMNYNALKSILDHSTAGATTQTDSTTGQTGSTALRSQTDGTYYFADVSDYESFQSSVYGMGLSEDYTVSSSDVNAFEQSLQPLNNLSTFAGWFLLLIFILGSAILVIFQIFHIRERQYEIGVLTAIGMKKWKVLLQFLTEIFLVTFSALIIGTAAGVAASVPVTNALLSTQTSSSQQSTDPLHTEDRSGQQPPQDFSPNGSQGKTVSAITQVHSAANWKVVLELIGIGVVLTILSGAAGAAIVMRYDPLKILSNRT